MIDPFSNLPPGVTDRDIAEHFGDARPTDDEREEADRSDADRWVDQAVDREANQ